jgi:hypothetical protein
MLTLHTQTRLFAIIGVDFDITDQLLRCFSFTRYGGGGGGGLYNGTLHQLFMDSKKACDEVRRKYCLKFLLNLHNQENT